MTSVLPIDPMRRDAQVRPRVGAALLGLGVAVPTAHPQIELAERMARAWALPPRVAERWFRIVAQSGVERRHAVADLADTQRLSTAERMLRFEREAPPLAAAAARAALRRSHVDAGEITDVVVVTCTGFASPGIGPGLVGTIGVPETARQNQIGFMGCFGGIVGLRTATALAAADREATVLLVCVELCSLHLRRDVAADQLVAAALFADGAVAAVLRGGSEGASALGRVDLGRTRLLAEGRDEMSWRIKDDGFAMTLTRAVPPAIEGAIGAFVAGDARVAAPAGIAPHPGGAGILDAIERGTAGLDLDPRSLAAGRSVLRDYGNMSSGTVLVVLDRYLASGGSRPVDLVAFGPGLTIDAVRLSE